MELLFSFKSCVSSMLMLVGGPACIFTGRFVLSYRSVDCNGLSKVTREFEVFPVIHFFLQGPPKK